MARRALAVLADPASPCYDFAPSISTGQVHFMSRSTAITWLASSCMGLAACSAIAAIAGAPKITSVTVTAPAGLLVGDSAVATADALGDDHKTHNGRPRTWRSSDPAALSIDQNGNIKALIGGRTVTITAEVDGTKGSATVGIANDHNQFGYALADQPTAAGSYVPDAANRFSSSGGTIEVTHTATGVYSVRFAGLGRAPGQRDNVQVSPYNATSPTYCKIDLWDASGADLRVPVVCFALPDGTPADSRFTILALGAWAFGRTAPLGFALVDGDTGAFRLDTLATARNSTGSNVDGGRSSEGQYGLQFTGLETSWTAAPAAVEVSSVGTGLRRCRLTAYDVPHAALGITCTRLAGGLGDAPFSVLWLQHGRPSMRFGFAWAYNSRATTAYDTYPDFLINSPGGSVKSRKTATGNTTSSSPDSPVPQEPPRPSCCRPCSSSPATGSATSCRGATRARATPAIASRCRRRSSSPKRFRRLQWFGFSNCGISRLVPRFIGSHGLVAGTPRARRFDIVPVGRVVLRPRRGLCNAGV